MLVRSAKLARASAHGKRVTVMTKDFDFLDDMRKFDGEDTCKPNPYLSTSFGLGGANSSAPGASAGGRKKRKKGGKTKNKK